MFRTICAISALLIILHSNVLAEDTVNYLQKDKEYVAADKEYVLSSGGIDDGQYIWVIPFETGSFAKIDKETGEAVDLSGVETYEKLNKLQGYKAGAYYESNGNRYIYLVPFLPTKPLVKINLYDMSLEYPVRSVGYYYGSAIITKDNGASFLWMFPSKIKPDGSGISTEIAKINLNEDKKEAVYSSEIEGRSVAYNDAILVNDKFWLLPEASGDPIVVMDITTGILSPKKMPESFDKYGAAVFDGKFVWIVAEKISFSINNSILLKCDYEGNIIDKRSLTKDRFVKALVDGSNLYLFAGAEQCYPKMIRMDIESGDVNLFDETTITNKKNYVPAFASINNKSLYVLPFTTDGYKMPIVKIENKHVYKNLNKLTIQKNNDGTYDCIVEIQDDNESVLAMGRIDLDYIFGELDIIEKKYASELTAIAEELAAINKENENERRKQYAYNALYFGNGASIDSTEERMNEQED